MASPTSVADLLERIRRSGLVPPDRLASFMGDLESIGEVVTTPADVLEKLVLAGMITRFHADRLAAGKYKGFQLGSYLILDQIGTGGMGQVYLAEHSTMRRLVALKVLPVFSSDDVVARERFFREARAAASLDHPNIVRVFDLCQEGKLLYLVMEYVEGISLQSLVARTGPVDVIAACHYVRQVAFGLQHAHDMGFVHRDIKPANLLLDRTGVIKILDLGLVRSEADAASGLTRRLDSKSILGTADYVAPEQARDSSGVDIRADIYSLGATFYFMLAGRPLFPEGRAAQKLVWQQVKDPVPITRLRPEVDAELAGIVHTMLQKDPDDRYQTPAEVFDALSDWTQDAILPPADGLMPPVPGRVAASRSGTTSPAAARAAGSSSQIVAAAMRSGPNSGSGSISSGGLSNPRSSRVVSKPQSRPALAPIPAAPAPSTDVVSVGDTRRTARPGSSRITVRQKAEGWEDEEPVAAPSSDRTRQIAIAALAVAILAAAGIAVLIFRG